VPVANGTLDALADAEQAAARIKAAAPIGARVVIAVRTSQPTLVALEASTGEMVGFYESMDPAVNRLTAESLADALAASPTR